MIYSRFGTPLTPISKEQDASGRISIQVAVEGVTDLRHYAVTDLKADDGMPEINATVASLPWQSVTRSAPRPDEKQTKSPSTR